MTKINFNEFVAAVETKEEKTFSGRLQSGYEVVRGVMPVTTKRFEKTVDHLQDNDIRLAIEIKRLQEAVGIDPLSEEEMEQAVNEIKTEDKIAAVREKSEQELNKKSHSEVLLEALEKVVQKSQETSSKVSQKASEAGGKVKDRVKKEAGRYDTKKAEKNLNEMSAILKKVMEDPELQQVMAEIDREADGEEGEVVQESEVQEEESAPQKAPEASGDWKQCEGCGKELSVKYEEAKCNKCLKKEKPDVTIQAKRVDGKKNKLEFDM